MLGFEWSNLTYLGAFVVGVYTGIIVTIRLTKIIAEHFRHKDKDNP